MPDWTHLIRFIAAEDSRVHLGQLVDTKRDVGLDTVEGREIKAYLINGSIFDGSVTKNVLTVKQVRCSLTPLPAIPIDSTNQRVQLLSPVSMQDCNYIRCLGLNYMDHAKVSPSLTFHTCIPDHTT